MSWTYRDTFGPLDLFVCRFPNSSRWAVYFLMQGVFSCDGRRTKNSTFSVVWYDINWHTKVEVTVDDSIAWLESWAGVWGRWQSRCHAYLSQHGSLTGLAGIVWFVPVLAQSRSLAMGVEGTLTQDPKIQLLYFTVRKLDKLECILILLFSNPLM